MRFVTGRLLGVAMLAAPTLLFLYGTSRLIDGIDGSYGPGPAWTIGHGLFLTSFVLFVAVLFGLWSLTVRTKIAGLLVACLALVFGLVGAAGFIRVILIDLWVGVNAGTNAQMGELSVSLRGWPWSPLSPVYDSAPLFFVIGMIVLVAHLAVQKPPGVPWWSPITLFTGFLLITLNIDLISLGAILLGIALWPLAAAGLRRPPPVVREGPV